MGTMLFPGEQPAEKNNISQERMDKETWIKSRTDNPDRIGKDVWGAVYDLYKASV